MLAFHFVRYYFLAMFYFFLIKAQKKVLGIIMGNLSLRANSFGSYDFPIQLRAYEFISNLVVGISELVCWRN